MPLDLLIAEDSPREIYHASQALKMYGGITAALVTTVKAALDRRPLPQVAILDVQVPYDEGSQPDAYRVLALEAFYLSQRPVIPFVYNTSLNHRDAVVRPIRDRSLCLYEDYGFGIGQVFESPSESDSQPETVRQPKPWKEVIDYAILVAHAMADAKSVDPRIINILQNEFFAFPRWGDYGCLPDVLQALLDPGITIDDLYRRKSAPWENIPSLPKRAWSMKQWGLDGTSPGAAVNKQTFEDALQFVRSTVGAYRSLP